MWKSLVRTAAAAALLALLPSAYAEPIRLTDREVAIYYGTWTVFQEGNPTPIGSFDFVQLDDLIVEELRQAILNDLTADPRIGPQLSVFIGSDPDPVAWAIGSPLGLNAAGSFQALIAGLGGIVSFDTGYTASGLRTYLLATADTLETAPVFVGDTDAPELFGNLGDEVTVTNHYIGEVSFFERNGAITVSAVPEPASAALIALGLAALACLHRRR